MERGRGMCVHRFCTGVICAIVFALLAGLVIAGFAVDVRLRAPEVISYTIGLQPGTLAGMFAMLAVMCALSALFRRAGIRLTAGVLFLWMGLTIFFLWAAGTRQMVDFAYVCDGATRFAQGDYSPLLEDYFNVYSYQLGTCLMLEGVARLLPGVHIGMVMQYVNAALSAGTVIVLAALYGVLCGERRGAYAASALAVTGLCIPLYCIHVYGTIPMIFLCACAFLSFALCVRGRGIAWGILCALCMALAYMVKPNAAVAVLALLICGALHALSTGDMHPLACVAMGAVLGVALAGFAVWQYEWRGGVQLREDISALARLVMGLQDGPRGAGWYSGYTEQFFSAGVSARQQRQTAMADLTARLEQMGEDPLRTGIFFVQKALSQWLEPTYGTLLYGNACEQHGLFAQAAQAVFSEQSPLRMALEGIMKSWQQALYALSVAGMWRTGRRNRSKPDAAALVLPVTVWGGFLYHMIFEAKSQYIYTYALYLLPLAAQGLCALEDAVCALSRRVKRAEAARA